jgi:hypothetical protein
MEKISRPTKSKYLFYKDPRIIAIIIVLTVVTLQIAAFTHTPVLVTIHAYTIGMLFGQYSMFFYFYCLIIAATLLLKPIRILKVIKLTHITY